MHKLDHFIDGASRPPQSARYLDGHNPWTGQVVSAVARGDASDVDAAVSAARRAFGGWAGLRPSARGRVLVRQRETWKTFVEAMRLITEPHHA